MSKRASVGNIEITRAALEADLEILSGRIGQCAPIEIQSSRAARLTSEVGLSGTWGDRIYTARDVHDARMGRATLVASDCKELGRRRSAGNIERSIAVVANADGDFIDVDSCSPADAHRASAVRADFERRTAVSGQRTAADVVARTSRPCTVSNRHPPTEAHRTTRLGDVSDAAIYTDEHVVHAIECAARDVHVASASSTRTDLKGLCATGTIDRRETGRYIQITSPAAVSYCKTTDTNRQRAALDAQRSRRPRRIAHIGARRSGRELAVRLHTHSPCTGTSSATLRTANGQSDIIGCQIEQ